jgi:hypothetical protein
MKIIGPNGSSAQSSLGYYQVLRTVRQGWERAVKLMELTFPVLTDIFTLCKAANGVEFLASPYYLRLP